MDVVLDALPVGVPLAHDDHQVVGGVEERVEPDQVTLRRVPGREARDQPAQGDLHLGQVPDRGVPDHRDDHRPRPGAFDEAVLFQAPDRFADRGGADGEAFGQAPFGDLFARAQVARGDGALHRAVGAVGERLRHRGGR